MPIYDRWVLQEARDDASIGFVSPVLRGIAARRGVQGEESFRRFVSPSISDLHDAALIHGVSEACERIERAIRDREQILIYGDYDVDGVTSIVLLQTVLRSLGARVRYVVPHRLFDGYGLKMEVLDRVLVDESVRLVVTVDCGITSVEPVERALERGIDVIITDHHLPPGILPEAAAVLNPKQPGCTYPFKELAGVGVAFKLCCELLRRNSGRVSVASLLKIAAIGTIADVAPLVEENRWIARIGLDGLFEVRNPGLRMLFRVAGVSGPKPRATDIGFRVGPRINAAGRLASADTAIRLFEATSDEDAYRLAMELERLNRERQSVEKEVLSAADESVRGAADRSVLVVAGEGWHKGVLGLCASRLAQSRHRPTLMIAIDGDECVGSARSVGEIDLHAALATCEELFLRFGGHAYACGFALRRENLEPLRVRLEEHFDALPRSMFDHVAEIDGVLTVSQIDAAFGAEHEALEPFGAGNPQPLFLVRDARARLRREFAADCFGFDVDDSGGSLPAVLWPAQKELVPLLTGTAGVDLLVRIEPDRFSPGGLRAVIADAAAAGVTMPARNESPSEAVVE